MVGVPPVPAGAVAGQHQRGQRAQRVGERGQRRARRAPPPRRGAFACSGRGCGRTRRSAAARPRRARAARGARSRARARTAPTSPRRARASASRPRPSTRRSRGSMRADLLVRLAPHHHARRLHPADLAHLVARALHGQAAVQEQGAGERARARPGSRHADGCWRARRDRRCARPPTPARGRGRQPRAQRVGGAGRELGVLVQQQQPAAAAARHQLRVVLRLAAAPVQRDQLDASRRSAPGRRRRCRRARRCRAPAPRTGPRADGANTESRHRSRSSRPSVLTMQIEISGAADTSRPT